ncbi:MAG TPA: TetR/AcrR family transcriptional regulator [Polyangiaceae bacterium]|nr:TetR/AcrR family transcriptional regulator [Polyangiaceae bacterium]
MPSSKGASRRRSLNPHRIAHAALKLIDRRGLESFSMHKLGTALGCEAMSLYHHFHGRGEVLDAVAGLLMSEVLLPPEGSWKERLREFVRSYRAVATRHPRAFRLLASRPINAAMGLEMLESCCAIFHSAGFDPVTIGRLVLLVGCWCNGALLAEIAGTDAGPDPTPPRAPSMPEIAMRYPRLAASAPHLSLCDFGPAFEFGIESLIKLIESMVPRT